MARRKTDDHFGFTPGVRAMIRETKGESDRAMALTMGAVIDSQVHAIVRKRLLSGLHGRSRLFDGPAAPLGTAFARNAFLYEIGAISSALHADLELVRRVRNQFAHEWAINSFSHRRVAGLVDNLQPNDGPSGSAKRRARMRLPFATPVIGSSALPHRSRFGLAIIAILVVLFTVRKESKKPKKPRREPIYGMGSKLDAVQFWIDSHELEQAGVQLLPGTRKRRRAGPRGKKG
jgi:hypothetical protein